jgi:hypothetical protein
MMAKQGTSIPVKPVKVFDKESKVFSALQLLLRHGKPRFVLAYSYKE